jgi:hypothetical protein
MRPHGKATIDARQPRALAICDRCQFMVFHDSLKWQMRWRGPRLQNIRILVCPECYDIPNEQERTIVFPVDPVPIANPRPENYALADNPASNLGYDPSNKFFPTSQRGMNFGNMTFGAGVDAAFDGGVVSSSLGVTGGRPFAQSAVLLNSISSFENTVGKNWAADATGTLATLPSTVPAQTHIVSSFTLFAPNDRGFLNSATGVTGFHLDGSANGGAWTTIYSGTTVGGRGEIITATTTAAIPFQYHRIAIQGDGISSVAIAQAVFNISDAGNNEI